VKWLVTSRAVLSVALLAALLPGKVAAQDRTPLPDLAWGTPLRQIRALHVLRTPDGAWTDRLPVSMSRLGGAELALCEIEVTDSLFSGIVLMTLGRENTAALLRYFESRFGRGDGAEARSRQWMQGDTYISFDEDSAGDGYVLWYGISWQGDEQEHRQR
jgi:hypothetical protein